jgi:hypothetical protein
MRVVLDMMEKTVTIVSVTIVPCGNLLAMGTEAEMISISLAASARTGPSHRAEYATVASEGLKRRRAGLAIVEERDRSASSRRTNHRIRHRPESRVT